MRLLGGPAAASDGLQVGAADGHGEAVAEVELGLAGSGDGMIRDPPAAMHLEALIFRQLSRGVGQAHQQHVRSAVGVNLQIMVLGLERD